MTDAIINHWPVFKGIRLCGDKADMASANSPITCPHCRAKLEAKVAAHTAEAARSKGSQKRFFAADAANWQRVLDGGYAADAIRIPA